jgi:DNA repair protein RadC
MTQLTTKNGEILLAFPKGAKANSNKKVIRLLEDIADSDQEYVIVITVDGGYHIKNIRVIGIGTYNYTKVSVRTVLKGAIIDSAFGVIFVHNHTFGNLNPSKADKKFIKHLVKIGKYMDIEICDSLIIHGNRWRSMFKKETKNNDGTQL